MDNIVFKDAGFERAVKKQLNIFDRQVTAQDLSVIKGVLVTSGAARGFSVPWTGDSSAFQMIFPDLFFDINESENGQWGSDLQFFLHIQSLHIYVPTDNLKFLGAFRNLEELYITDSLNSDFSFIKDLINLRFLYMYNCRFNNLTQLHDLCVKQEERYNRWKKHKGMSLFKNRLKNVALIQCGISIIEPLAACKSIVELNLSQNSISDLTPLNGIKNLYYLTLRHNCLEDITPLEYMEGIYLMNLRHNNISNIKALENLKDTNLSRLFIGHNPIKDFSPLKYVELIEHDIDKFDKRSREEYKKQSNKMVAARKDIIGRWSDGSVSLTGPDETIIAFEENGTGFIKYVYGDHTMLDTFRWNFDNGYISKNGIKRYNLAKDIPIYDIDGSLRTDTINFAGYTLLGVSDSSINFSNVEVWTYETEALDGSFIKALYFSEPLDVTCDHEYGLESRDIWNGDFYSKLKGIIRKYS